MSKVRDLAVDALIQLRQRLDQSSFLKSILYDAWNRRTFSHLYQHDVMIADRVRVDSYYQAITRGVRKGDVVVDLGTGTGILSFFAAQCNPGKIYAIDHSDIIETAKLIAEHNDIHCIEFIKGDSKEINIEEKADVIIHEQIGNYLLSERMTETISDLRDRLLKPAGRIIPSRFAIFMGPVALKEEYRVPFIWEAPVHGVRLDILKDGGFSKGDRQEYGGKGMYLWRPIDNCSADYFLCQPEQILTIDLNTINPAKFPKRLEFRKTITAGGRLDGLCLFFKVIFDEEISFDNSPFSRYTHWRPVMYRVEAQHLEEGDVLDVNLAMDDPADISTWTLKYSRS